MAMLSFLKNAVQQYFAEPPAPKVPMPSPFPEALTPRVESAPVRKVQQGRVTDPDEIERHEPMEAPLISERYSYVDLRAFLKLYTNHVWTYRCSTVIAASCASVKFNWMKNGKIVPPDQVVGFYAKPNSYMTWYDLIELCFLHLELAGNAFWEIQRDETGAIIAIYPLRPDRVRIIPDAKKRIKRYEYWVPGAADYIKYEPQELLHLKYTDAMSEYYGAPPSAAASNDTVQDLYMTAWNKDFFAKGAEPGVVLSTPNSLSEIAFNRISRLWNRRHRGKPHEVAILEEGMTCIPMSSKHTDLQFIQGKEQQRDTIIAAYGVPPVLVGVVGKTGSSISDEKKIFWQHNIIPKIHRLEQFLNQFLLLAGYKVDFVTKTLATIIEDEKIKADIAQSNVTHGIWTINEARRIEWDMDDVPWGDSWWAPVGLYDVQNVKTHPTAIASKYAPAPTPGGPTGPAGPAGKDPISRSTVTSGSDAGIKSPSQVKSQPAPVGRPRVSKSQWIDKMAMKDPDWTNRMAVRDYTEYLLWKQASGPDERELHDKILAMFKEQGERIAGRLEAYWPIKKDTDGLIDMVFDAQQEDHTVTAVLIPEALKILKKYGAQQLATLGIQKQFNLTNERVQKFLADYAAQKVRQINDTTRQILRDTLTEASTEGESVKAVISRIVDSFDGDVAAMRAERIARTELVSLTNTSRYEAAIDSGVVTYKRWISEKIDTTRENPKGENHFVMDGQVRKIDEPFDAMSRTGPEQMDTPGDLNASAENVVNCLCIASYYAGTSEFEDILMPEGTPEEVPIVKDTPLPEETEAAPAPTPQPIHITVNVPPATPAPVTVVAAAGETVVPAPAPEPVSKKEDKEQVDPAIQTEMAALALLRTLERISKKEDPK